MIVGLGVVRRWLVGGIGRRDWPQIRVGGVSDILNTIRI